MSKNWRAQKEPLQQISGNATSDLQPAKPKAPSSEEIPEQLSQKSTIDEENAQSQVHDGPSEGKAGKARRFKVQGETQTGIQKLLDRLHTPANADCSQNEV